MNMTKRTVGLTMAIVGLVLLILNALDYLLGWNQISSAFTPISVMLALIGAGLARYPKKDQQKLEKQ